MKMLTTTDTGFDALWRELCQRNPTDAEDLAIVDEIMLDVQQNGSQAVLKWSNKFDASRYQQLSDAIMVPDASWLEGVDPELIASLKLAKERIEAYHRRQLPLDFSYQDEQGNTMGSRWSAMQRVGLYVPGGKAAYPSSVLMNALPARIAGVQELVMVTPPGYMKPAVRAAAFLAGVDVVIAVGGIQAVALLTYGAYDCAEQFRPVDAIVGPGNRYVAAAKRKAFGRVSIDMIAGPSEVLILADGSVDAEWVAADLLSQVEHDEKAICGVIATDRDYLNAVLKALQKRAATTARSEIALQAIEQHAFGVLTNSRQQMVELSNQYAPEHLELAVENARQMLDDIGAAGSIFVGPWCPEPVGDYLAGPNHVLPTSGSARFFSPLGVDTFMKRTAWTEWTQEGLAFYREHIERLAESEELIAHADSVRVRFGS